MGQCALRFEVIKHALTSGSTARSWKLSCISQARRTGAVKGPLERCLTTTSRQVPSGSYATRLLAVKVRVKDMLDDPESEKWPIRYTWRLSAIKVGCIQVLDDSESSIPMFGALDARAQILEHQGKYLRREGT